MADITGYRWRVWADTAATLTTQNPTLLSGEIVKESDTGKMKIGDGSTAWSSLPYYVPAGSASYNFTIDTTSNAVAMTASDSWVYSDGFTGTTYPSALNAVLSDGDIVTFKNTGAAGYHVTGLPDGRPLLDGEIISYIFVDGSFSNISEQPPIVRAEYNSSSGQTITSTLSVLDFDTVVEDTHSAVTTGSGWKFLAPIGGSFQIDCDILSSSRIWQSGVYGNITVYKNDSAVGFISRPAGNATDGSFNIDFSGSTNIGMNKGDYITIKMDRGSQTSNYTLQPTSWRMRITINRIGN